MVEKWLYWPTKYPVVTQKFLNRPEYYSQFGLPGHEGVDVRAPNGTDLYSCADGTVSEVGFRGGNRKHAYGYAIRVIHKRPDGIYETLFAHGVDGRAVVKVGQEVKAGQLLMLSDSTGNSSGAHLHLSLKKTIRTGKNIKPPTGLETLDYFYLSNGEILMNPMAFMWPFEIKPPKPSEPDLLDRVLSRV